ncbi:hypothetical protein LEMLEM_LOCUS7314 [Lemmus lemmus]
MEKFNCKQSQAFAEGHEPTEEVNARDSEGNHISGGRKQENIVGQRNSRKKLGS